MLKELFVLRSGTPLFYYSEKELNEAEIDQSLLSSGLLSAISSFSEEARSSELQSFSSENETFVFQKLPQYDAILAGAFDNTVSIKVANIILNIIKIEIHDVGLLDDQNNTTTVDLLAPEKLAFSKKIPELLTRMTDKEAQQDYFGAVVHDIPGVFLAMVINLEENQLTYNFARPRPLFRSEYQDDLQLIYKVTNNMIAKTHLGHRMRALSVMGGDKIFSTFTNDLTTSFLASNMSDKQLIEEGARKLGHSTLSNTSRQNKPTGKYLLRNRDLLFIEGQEFLTKNAKIFIMTVLNNIEKLFDKIFNTEYEVIDLSIETEDKKQLVLKFVKENHEDIVLMKIV